MPLGNVISQSDTSFFLLMVQSPCNTLDISWQVDCVRAMKDKEPWQIFMRNRLTTALNVNGFKGPFRTHDMIAGAVSFKFSGSRHLEKFGKPGK